MKLTIPQLKQVKTTLINAGCDALQVGKIIESASDADIQEILAGSIPSSLGKKWASDHGEKSPQIDEIQKSSCMENKRGSASDIIPADDTSNNMESCEGDSVPAVDILDNNELPASVVYDIKDIISEWCDEYHVDDITKITAERWRGLCLAVGRHFKKTTILHDTKREKLHGGIIYNPYKIEKLLEVWHEMCLTFNKVPLASDFIAFSGISESYFYDNAGHDVSSSRVELCQKLRRLQESGLSSRLVDGRVNPTGTIFFLKNWHGWKDSREVVHTASSSSVGADALPMLGDNGGI